MIYDPDFSRSDLLEMHQEKKNTLELPLKGVSLFK